MNWPSSWIEAEPAASAAAKAATIARARASSASLGVKISLAGAGMRHLGLVARPVEVHVDGIIAGAEGEAADARPRRGDLAHRGDAGAGLDDGHEIDGAWLESGS